MGYQCLVIDYGIIVNVQFWQDYCFGVDLYIVVDYGVIGWFEGVIGCGKG